MSRELLKRALKHLPYFNLSKDKGDEIGRTMADIIAELAKPEPKPVAWINRDDLDFLKEHHNNYKTVLLFASQVGHQIPLYTTPPDQSTRIVAWLWKSDNNQDQRVFMRKFEAEQMMFKHGGVIYPLTYAELRCQLSDDEMACREMKNNFISQRKPLSDDEIIDIAVETLTLYPDKNDLVFARAIERAHGI